MRRFALAVSGGQLDGDHQLTGEFGPNRMAPRERACPSCLLLLRQAGYEHLSPNRQEDSWTSLPS
jgi:hypothetical protein